MADRWTSPDFTRRCERATRHGDFSYDIYLCGFPIRQDVMLTIGHPVDGLELFALSDLPAVTAGIASWLLIERRSFGWVSSGRPLRRPHASLLATAAPLGGL
jgi:hypothetical protein